MKYPLLFLMIAFCSSGYGQELKNKDVRGVYERSFGDPARTIHRGDSNYISISYMEYQKDILKLKWFGKFTLQETSTLVVEVGKKRGKWWIENGLIHLEMDGKVQKYSFRFPVYLELEDQSGGFQKRLD